jgi:predicted Zn finger-like uncharacterized protein
MTGQSILPGRGFAMPTMLRLRCPSCKALFSIAKDAASNRVRCPQCSTQASVRERSEEDKPEAVAPAGMASTSPTTPVPPVATVEPVSPPPLPAPAPLPTPAPVVVEHADPWNLSAQAGQDTLVMVPQRATRKSRPVQRLAVMVVCLALATGIGFAVVPRQAPGEQNAEVAELQRRVRDAAEESDARAERLLERMEALERELATRMRAEKKGVPLSTEALFAKASPAVVLVMTD